MKKSFLLLSAVIIVIILTNCDSTPEKKKDMPRPATLDTGSTKSPIEAGLEMAMKTKAVLGKYLLTAIQDKGTDGAVEFCSTRAILITDSMSNILGSRIKRVSEKNRNPINIAGKEQLSYIKEIKEILARNERLQPKLTESGDSYTGYYPILTDQLCLQCHGDKKTDINPPTLSMINRLYPGDKATGYKLNELRGIWVVEMKKTDLPNFTR